MVNLEVNFCGVNFKNPTVLASGVLGVSGESLHEVVENGAGGVTSKSIWLEGHKGHKNPVIIATDNYVVNAVGLSDAGIEKARNEISEYKKQCDAPLIANIVASKIDDFAEITKKISELNVDLIEVNISCPNVEVEFGRPFACDIKSASEVTETVRKNTKTPFSVKLSPNVDNIGEIAKACEESGADAITAINTVGPGMRINIEMRRSILKNKVGGVSGHAVFPIAIRCIHDIYKNVKIPIIGTGGVSTGEEAIEMMIAGASLIGVGSGVYYRGIKVFSHITEEMNAWCDKNNVKNAQDLIGSLLDGFFYKDLL
ncbi:MAG: dihydroorotate dehydrogenase [Candidatus Gracilibacteria bacterium]|nr:dihydroorotate dehydrogenase [Candidatus Gracilibacteria bacterium]